MNKKNVRPLTAQEMENISGGCWLCDAWSWLKKHIRWGKTASNVEGKYPGAQQGGSGPILTIPVGCCAVTMDSAPQCLDKPVEAVAF